MEGYFLIRKGMEAREKMGTRKKCKEIRAWNEEDRRDAGIIYAWKTII